MRGLSSPQTNPYHLLNNMSLRVLCTRFLRSRVQPRRQNNWGAQVVGHATGCGGTSLAPVRTADLSRRNRQTGRTDCNCAVMGWHKETRSLLPMYLHDAFPRFPSQRRRPTRQNKHTHTAPTEAAEGRSESKTCREISAARGIRGTQAEVRRAGRVFE